MLRIAGRFTSKNIESKTRLVLEFKLYKPIRCYAKDICPPPPPRPKKKGGGSGAIYTLGALALAGGATIGYAKYDPDFRRTLAEYVPVTDKVIKVIFQEEASLLASLNSVYEGIKNVLSKSMTHDKKDKKIIDDSKPYKAPPPVISSLESSEKAPESYTEIRLDEKNKDEPEIAGEPRPKEEELCLPDTHPSNLAELEERICEAATDAVNAYNKAIYNLKVYNQEIGLMIDQAVEEVQPTQWETIKAKTRAKNEAIELAETKAKEAEDNVRKLKNLLSKPDFEPSPQMREMVKLNIQKVQDDISAARRAFELERRLGSLSEKYWDKVKQARKFFGEELEALFPSIDLDDKKLEVNESELDLFLLHTYAKVLFYQKELAKMETISRERLLAAVESARRGGGEPLTNAQICEAVDQEKRRITLCYQQQCLKLRREGEMELREQLKRQSQVFADHLDEAVKTRALEIERLLTRKFDEEIEKEKARYKMQLAAMVGRLKGFDHAIKVRDQADQVAKQSQVLWSACQALLRAIHSGCPGVPWKDQLRPLDPEISSVKKAAAKGDELVEAVIAGIPPEAKDRGVFPENALRERFIKVEEVARSVALVPEGGGALPLHILSYVQAFFLIKSPSPIPQAELNDEEVDFTALTTNEILQRARYWVDRGDFAQTLKYMNLLKGAPRSVARQWMNETRILLETQQAANTLMAHAASSGLMYL